MRGSLVPIEHRRDTGVRAFQQDAPLIARASAEKIGQPHLQTRPPAPVGLVIEIGIVRESHDAPKLRIELRLDRPDGDELAIGAGIGIVEMRAAIEQVFAALVVP